MFETPMESFDAFKRFIVYIPFAGAALYIALTQAGRLVKYALELLFPPTSVFVSVIDKRIEVKAKDSSKKAYTLYYVTFQSDYYGGNRERTEYGTSSDDYAVITQGDKGLLRLHMGKFKSFKRIE